MSPYLKSIGYRFDYVLDQVLQRFHLASIDSKEKIRFFLIFFFLDKKSKNKELMLKIRIYRLLSTRDGKMKKEEKWKCMLGE